MPRPRRVDRSTVAEKNVTFRASPRTRDLLEGLVAQAKVKSAAFGGSATISSYLTKLIEREAEAGGIGESDPAPSQESPRAAKPKAARKTGS
jgi:hypothetical protein